MDRPVAYSGKPYPFTQLSDREFEEIVYNIFREEIEAGEYTGRFDRVDLMPGVGEQGRDCKLYFQGTIVGNVQCKNQEENIAKPQLLEELIKFSLNYLLDSSLIPIQNNFTYFFVAAKGFSTPTIDLVGEIRKRINSEPEFEKRLRAVINKMAAFKKADFTITNTRSKVVNLLKTISIELINSSDLNRMLSHANSVASQFFEVRKVIDTDSFRKIIEEIFSQNLNRQNAIFEYLLDTAIEYSKKLVTDLKSDLKANRKDVQGALINHLKSIYQWCSEISFNDLKKAKKTSNVFVELDMYLYPRRLRIDMAEKVELVPLRNIFKGGYRHFVILGQPGAGKTTSVKYLCHKTLTDPDFHPELFNLPIVIRLRELNFEIGRNARVENPAFIRGVIFRHLFSLLNLDIQFADFFLSPDEVDRRSKLIEQIVIRFLDELMALLILDGFDEITHSEVRDITLQEIRRLAEQLQTATMIVTSRTGEFPYHIENAKQFEISPLSEDQIVQFSLKWLEDEDRVTRFLEDIANSPFSDTTIKPLTLAHLCAIFERSGRIPDKPKTVYKKIINLLLEEWDEQRSVQRISKYANFEIDRKFEFLCNLALPLTAP